MSEVIKKNKSELEIGTPYLLQKMNFIKMPIPYRIYSDVVAKSRRSKHENFSVPYRFQIDYLKLLSKLQIFFESESMGRQQLVVRLKTSRDEAKTVILIAVKRASQTANHIWTDSIAPSPPLEERGKGRRKMMRQAADGKEEGARGRWGRRGDEEEQRRGEEREKQDKL